MSLSAEQLEIRELARDFALAEIRPSIAEWDEARAMDDSVLAKLGELGFMGMMVPENHGGLGLDVVTYLVALEQIAWGDASVALSVAIQNGPLSSLLIDQASDAQKAGWLPQLASGDVIGAFALSEPEAGSDSSALSTVAEPMEEGWRIRGKKRWVTNGDRAGLITVFARILTNSAEGDPIGAFVLERTTPGYTLGRREKTMGLRASETVEVILDDVRVSEAHRLPLEGDGFLPVLRALDMARLGDAAISIGVAQAAFEHAIRYALERSQFGRAIADFGAIQSKLAEMATRIAGARALTLDAGGRFEEARPDDAPSPPPGVESLRAVAAMAKLAASDAALWVADEAVQIYGGYGYMRDYPVERLLRDAKGTQLLEGTNEIMRLAIALEVLKEAKEN